MVAADAEKSGGYPLPALQRGKVSGILLSVHIHCVLAAVLTLLSRYDFYRGTCPFGTSCFYAHRYPDGSIASREVRTAVDSDGQYDVLRQIRLEHYLQQQPAE